MNLPESGIDAINIAYHYLGVNKIIEVLPGKPGWLTNVINAVTIFSSSMKPDASIHRLPLPIKTM
jgi:hypothetical protein